MDEAKGKEGIEESTKVETPATGSGSEPTSTSPVVTTSVTESTASTASTETVKPEGETTEVADTTSEDTVAAESQTVTATASVTISLGVGPIQASLPKTSPPLTNPSGEVQQIVNPLSKSKEKEQAAVVESKGNKDKDQIKPETTEVSVTEAAVVSASDNGASIVRTTSGSVTLPSSTVSEAGSGLKRPAAPDSAPGSVGGETSGDSEAEGDPKKKKMRKENLKDNRSECPSVNPTSSGGSAASNGSRGSNKLKPTKNGSTPCGIPKEDENDVPPKSNESFTDMSVKDASGTPQPTEPPASNVLEDSKTDNVSEASIVEPMDTSDGDQAADSSKPVVESSVTPSPTQPGDVTMPTVQTGNGSQAISSSTEMINQKEDKQKTMSAESSVSPAATADTESSKPQVEASSSTPIASGVSTPSSDSPLSAQGEGDKPASKEGKVSRKDVTSPVPEDSVSKTKEKREEGVKDKEGGIRKDKDKEKDKDKFVDDKSDKDSKDSKEGGPKRMTRSSHRIMEKHHVGGTSSHMPNSPSNSISPKTSACPSPSTSQQGDEPEPVVDLHPRKRKLKQPKDAMSASGSGSTPTTSTPSDKDKEKESLEHSAGGSNASDPPPMMNCYEMWFNIRKQIARKRRNLFPVTPKPPKGFKDYLMNRKTYVLHGNPNAHMAVPTLNAPQSVNHQLKETFMEQEKARHKLRLQHLVEKEKLVLAVEQEILRVHSKAARCLANQTLPLSVCTILKDEEIYNLLTPEQEEKDMNARSRYNGRLFLSWLQDLDDKAERTKEQMLLRHHNEAESLHAVQKMEWEWKLKELGLCEPRASPAIEEYHVPMVHVSDDFDLLPA